MSQKKSVAFDQLFRGFVDLKYVCNERPELSPGEQRLLASFQSYVDERMPLFQFLSYAFGTYHLGRLLGGFKDQRREPKIKTFDVLLSLFMAAIMRVPSLNELEEMLEEGQFRRVFGHGLRSKKKFFSADTMSRVLDTLNVRIQEQGLVDLVKMAERNKAFRDDTYGTFRCVAIDGWEPFCTYRRHCDGCLTREVTIKEVDEDGVEHKRKVTQYYHRYVVALMVAPKLDMTLAIEPVLPADLREDLGDKEARHEGELTAALRLIDRLHQDYGTFIDAFVLDGLYPCGPVLKKLSKYRYGAFIIAKNKKNDPYRFANEIWEAQNSSGEKQIDPYTNEPVEFWHMKNVNALQSFDGEVDVLKATVTRKNGKQSTWVMITLGKARQASKLMTLRIMRSRWHIENTAFHQWVTHWNLDHCYRHTRNGITSVLHIWALAFNLMQLFFYRRLKKKRKGRKVTDTIKVMIRKMWVNAGRLDAPIPWHYLNDTG